MLGRSPLIFEPRERCRPRRRERGERALPVRASARDDVESKLTRDARIETGRVAATLEVGDRVDLEGEGIGAARAAVDAAAAGPARSCARPTTGGTRSSPTARTTATRLVGGAPQRVRGFLRGEGLLGVLVQDLVARRRRPAFLFGASPGGRATAGGSRGRSCTRRRPDAGSAAAATATADGAGGTGGATARPAERTGVASAVTRTLGRLERGGRATARAQSARGSS